MDGLRAAIDDLVRSSTTGDEIRNADGDITVVYTDIVGYVADYLETGHALDILGQNGNGPCHLCAFLKFTGNPKLASKYAYSTEIHSTDTCYAHMWERTDCLRSARTTDEELVGVGLNRAEQAVRKNSPLIELAAKLKAACEGSTILLTEVGKPVVNPRFDAYRSVLVSPDHVLFGVSTNALNFAFSVLSSNTWRRQVDVMICEAIRSNGLGSEAQVYNPRTSTVHAASISMRFATLLIAPAVFSEVIDNCRAKSLFNVNVYRPIAASLLNLTRLRDLVAATYWFPDVKVEGLDAVRMFNANHGRERIAKLERMCEDYVRGINSICREFPGVSSELDKPNVHRMLELYKHSIPSMGHVRHFAELVFETAHQPLKRAMQKSNFRDSHLQSSWTSIVDDWRRRLQSVMSADDGENEARFKEKEVLKLICGRRTDVFDGLTADHSFMAELSATLRNELVLTLLNSSPTTLNLKRLQHEWIATMPSDGSTLTAAEMQSMADVRRLVNDLLLEQNPRTVVVYGRATRIRFVLSNGQAIPLKHSDVDIVQRGSVVQAFIEDSKALLLTPCERDEASSGQVGYFVVQLVLCFRNNLPSNVGEHRDRNVCYAAVSRCEVHHGLLHIHRTGYTQILRLSDGVRRVCLVHACHHDHEPGCLSNPDSAGTCKGSIFDGNNFHFWGREQGYPPLMA